MHQGFQNLLIESNCNLLVEEVLSPQAPNSILGNIVMDIRNILLHFLNFSLQYCSPECNYAAHYLAKHAWQVDDIVMWMGVPPSS